jgi:AraC-like DNA-binding protein
VLFHRAAVDSSRVTLLMTRRIERAMALLHRGDLSVTEVCFAVGCSSLGTFSTRFTDLTGMPSSVTKQVTGPSRNREAPSKSRT